MLKDTLKFWVLIIIGLLLIGAATFARAGMADCDPPVRQDGTTIGFDWVDGPVGRHVFLFCTDTVGRIRDEGLSCRNDLCNAKTLTDVATSVLAAPDRKKAIADAEAKYLRWTCAAPPAAEAALCAERLKIWRDNFARWTEGYTPPTFRVKVNGAITTRPSTYLIDSKAGPRAPVGALCLTDKPLGLPSGADIRAQWVGGPDGVVTICAKAVNG